MWNGSYYHNYNNFSNYNIHYINIFYPSESPIPCLYLHMPTLCHVTYVNLYQSTNYNSMNCLKGVSKTNLDISNDMKYTQFKQLKTKTTTHCVYVIQLSYCYNVQSYIRIFKTNVCKEKIKRELNYVNTPTLKS